MKLNFYLRILMILVAISGIGVLSNGQSLSKATEAYQAGKYDEAIKTYESIRESGQASLALYYNLGNSYYKKDQIAKSILNFERALLIDPGNEDVLYNLSLARQQLKDEISELPGFFLADWWRALHRGASGGAWAGLTLLMVVLMAAGFILWLFGKDRRMRKRGFLAGLVAMGLSLLCGALAKSEYDYVHQNKFAIILPAEVSLKNGADESSNALMALHSGTKVEIIDRIGSWYKVRLSDGERGWLPLLEVERI